MSQATDWLEVELRKHLFRTGSMTKPTNVDIALYTATPGETGGGTEVTGGSYARVARNPLDANWSAASATDGVTNNVAAITFPTPSANWGVVTSFGIFMDSNLAVYGSLSVSKTVNNGDPAPAFAIGALTVTIA